MDDGHLMKHVSEIIKVTYFHCVLNRANTFFKTIYFKKQSNYCLAIQSSL